MQNAFTRMFMSDGICSWPLTTRGAYSATGDHVSDVRAMRKDLLLVVLVIVASAVCGQSFVIEGAVTASASRLSIVPWKSLHYPKFCTLYTVHALRLENIARFYCNELPSLSVPCPCLSSKR